jgi:glycosyltransferase involved in cell wall biosynthesis
MTPSNGIRTVPRVVILNNEIFPYRVQLFHELQAQGTIDWSVLFSTERSQERQWMIDRSILDFPYRILPGFCIQWPKPNYSEKRFIYFNPTLLFELIRLRPDVVIGYEFSVPALTGLLYTRLFGKRYIVWTDCTTHTDRNLSRGQRWTRAVIIPRARAYIGTTRASLRLLASMGAQPDRVLEAPQMHSAIRFGELVASARPAQKNPAPVLLYTGALSERKGLDFLLDSFFQVADRHPTVRLRLVGDGPLRSRLEEKARRSNAAARIDFMGFVEFDSIHREYAQADIFLLPTLEDAFGVVIVEALSGGVPVICSKYAGAADYLVDGENAFIVDPHDTAMMADRIQQLLSDSNLRTTFARRGKDLALLFDAPAVARIFETAIQLALRK